MATRKYIESEQLSIELYTEGSGRGMRFCAYLSDDCGSGITVEEKNPEKCAESLAAYIADYFYNNRY